MGFGKKRSSKVGVGAITTNKKKLFAEGGMMDDGKDVDPVSGNDVPTGSLAEEVRDDVDAKLSPGEFVIPADVVRFIGLERLMKLRDDAKQGLARMNDIGQMGNAEAVGEASDDSFEEDDNFENEIDGIMKEVDQNEIGRQTEMAFNTGGFVNASYYDIEKAPKNPALDIRFFKDVAGKDFYMPFINGRPMKPIPNGAIQQSSRPTKRITPSDPRGEAGGGGAGAVVGGVVTGTDNTSATTGSTATQQQQISDSQNAGASSGISGVYTGSNIADFGRSDMIYNPGGSGPSGEVVTEDLWNSSISNADVKLGTTVLSTLASAMGVPGIVTLPLRLAINKYGADAVNAYFGRLNQEMVGKAGGVDTSTPEGIASAASQIDQVRDRGDSKPAASAGAIGTGGIAAQASSAVADALKGTGLSDAEIGNLSQRAANAVVSGIDMNLAVNNAKNAAVDAIQEKFSDQFGLANVTREDIVNTVFGPSTVETRDLSGADFRSEFRGFDSVVDTGSIPSVQPSEPFDFTDDALFGDFWGTMDEGGQASSTEDEEELFDSGSWMGSTAPKIDASFFKKQESQER
jgi:hypothetical protein